MKQLKPQDAQFLFMEDGKIASHLTSILICDQSTAPEQPIRFKSILSKVEDRLSNSPIFSQKLMRLPFDVDFPYWVEDPHFELEYHVRHSRLPEPADWRQLCIHIARFHSRPLDMSRPLWEMHVTEGLDNIEGIKPGSFAILLKMHHAAVDGTSAQKFMFSMMDLGIDGPAIIPPPVGKALIRETSVSAPIVATKAALNNITAPVKLARAAFNLTPTVAKAAARSVLKRNDAQAKVPTTRFNGAVSPNRAFDAVSFDLADFKMIAKSFGEAKINDVVLAVVGGAMREYLESKKELPSESLVITAPVNKRINSDAISGADGNEVSAMSLPVFSNIANPVDRLKSIVRASQSAKAQKSGLASRVATDLSQHVPAATLSALSPILIQMGGADRVCNAFVSNVPGVQFPVYFCGAEVTDAFGMAPIGGGMGLFIATPSYNGKLAFSITTTRQIMPDTPFFMDCLRRALAELKQAATRKTKSSSTKSAGKRKKAPGSPSFHKTRKKAPSSKVATTKSKAKTKPAAKKKSATKKKVAAKANGSARPTA